MLVYLDLARQEADPRVATDLVRMGLEASRLSLTATYTATIPHPGWGRSLAETCVALGSELETHGSGPVMDGVVRGQRRESEAITQAARVEGAVRAYVTWAQGCSWPDERRSIIGTALGTALVGFAKSLDAAQSSASHDRIAREIVENDAMSNYEVCGGVSARVIARADFLRCADVSSDGRLAFPDPGGLASAVIRDVTTLETSRWPAIRAGRDLIAVVDELHRLPAFLRAAGMILRAVGSDDAGQELLVTLDEWRVRCEEAVQRCWSSVLQEIVRKGSGDHDGGGLEFLLPRSATVATRGITDASPHRWAGYSVDMEHFAVVAAVVDEHRGDSSVASPAPGDVA